MNKSDMAYLVDHTLLKADASESEIELLCKEALEAHFASVCVNPTHVQKCAKILRDSTVKVCTVIGFPLGANVLETKAFETRMAIRQGAQEIDMVINIGALKDGNYDLVLRDIQAVVSAAEGNTVKVIIETCYLTDEEKVRACELATTAGATFVKTSTGFGTAGATCEDVKLMKDHISQNMKVKASGGIRSLQQAEEMIACGASRLGTSSGLKIIEELND